jgi:hypothetical protein
VWNVDQIVVQLGGQLVAIAALVDGAAHGGGLECRAARALVVPVVTSSLARLYLMYPALRGNDVAPVRGMLAMIADRAGRVLLQAVSRAVQQDERVLWHGVGRAIEGRGMAAA